jgi:hypothetical protein
MLKQVGKSQDDYTLSFQRGEEEGFDFFFGRYSRSFVFLPTVN